MFKYKDEAYLKPSSFKSKSCILGIGNGFLLILLLSSLKSEMKRTVTFFLGIKNIDAAHSELLVFLKTSMFTNLRTSVLKAGIGLAW